MFVFIPNSELQKPKFGLRAMAEWAVWIDVEQQFFFLQVCWPSSEPEKANDLRTNCLAEKCFWLWDARDGEADNLPLSSASSQASVSPLDSAATPSPPRHSRVTFFGQKSATSHGVTQVTVCKSPFCEPPSNFVCPPSHSTPLWLQTIEPMDTIWKLASCHTSPEDGPVWHQTIPRMPGLEV